MAFGGPIAEGVSLWREAENADRLGSGFFELRITRIKRMGRAGAEGVSLWIPLWRDFTALRRERDPTLAGLHCVQEGEI